MIQVDENAPCRTLKNVNTGEELKIYSVPKEMALLCAAFVNGLSKTPEIKEDDFEGDLPETMMYIEYPGGSVFCSDFKITNPDWIEV